METAQTQEPQPVQDVQKEATPTPTPTPQVKEEQKVEMQEPEVQEIPTVKKNVFEYRTPAWKEVAGRIKKMF